jgi:class 3 adenylate cyclase
MICDLVGATALSSQLDPEDLREIIAAYQRTVSDTVTGFDGFVGNYLSDTVPVYFGYPRAHEDDAERAVRAGLGVIDAVARLDLKHVKLQTRIGIATGVVVVSEGSTQERSVVGEAPYIAAQLKVLAEPNTVVIAAGTPGCSAVSSSTSTSAPSRSRAPPRRCRLGRYCVRARSPAASRRCAARR